MMMRGLMLFLATMLPVASAGAAPRPAAKPICENDRLIQTGGAGSFRVRPLGEQPPAREIKAVRRTIDGCVTPLVVRAEVGQRRDR